MELWAKTGICFQVQGGEWKGKERTGREGR